VVEVKWSNMLDAEFAPTWSENVVHDQMEHHTNNREQNRIRPYDVVPGRSAETAEMRYEEEERRMMVEQEKERAREAAFQRKREKTLKHLALMKVLKGKKQNYPARNKGKMEGKEDKPADGSVVGEPKKKKKSKEERKEESRLRHQALMESLKGKQQNYPSRGKGKPKEGTEGAS